MPAPNASTKHSPRLWRIVASMTSIYIFCAGALALAWYAREEQTAFHWFDDSMEWRQADKAAHIFAAFHISYICHYMLAPALRNPWGWLWGGFCGFMWMLPIEILDGFAPGYGASASDLVANTVGVVAYMGQLALAGRVVVWPQFSFWPSGLAHLRPNLLGDNLGAQIAKDYNGHTYWLAIPLHDLGLRWGAVSRWLMLTVGINSTGMVYAHPQHNEAHGHSTSTSLLFSASLNLNQLENSRWFGLRLAGRLLVMLHFPAPAVELSPNGWRWVWLYY